MMTRATWMDARLRLPMLAALAALAACSGKPGNVSGAEDIGADSISDAAGDTRGEDGQDAREDAEAAPSCTRGTRTCFHGLVAKCSDDGTSWQLSACPAGQVCEHDTCVANPVQVALVVNPPTATVFEIALTDPVVYQAALDDACGENPLCCQYTQSAGSGIDVTGLALLAKYWARRVILSLSGLSNIHMALLGPPQREDSEGVDCSLTTKVDAAADNCLRGTRRLVGGPEFNQEASDLVGVEDYHASGGTHGPKSEYAPVDISELPSSAWSHVSEWHDLLVQAEDTPWELHDWVNYRADPGFDPEIALYPKFSAPPGPWRAHVYFSWLQAQAGKPCSSSLDCPEPGQICNLETGCSDAAAECRVRDLIIIGSFRTTMLAQDQPSCDYREDVDSPIGSHWMRWGCACGKGEPCPDGAVCDTTGGRGGDLTLEPTCTPSSILAQSAPSPPFGSLGTMVRWTTPPCEFFATGQPVDVQGNRWHARVHSILVHDEGDFDQPMSAQEEATAVAFFGDGVAVTPCRAGADPLDFDPMQVSHKVSCDWQARFQELIATIGADTEHVCSPDFLGLPDSLPADAIQP